MKGTNALRGLVACAVLLLAAAPAAAQSAARAADADTSAADGSDDWSAWVKTLEDHARKLRELRKTSTALEDEVSEAISRRRPRGEEKARLLAANERAKKDLAEAEAQLPELVEQARQAGVPQGLLQDYEDLADEYATKDDDEGDW